MQKITENALYGPKDKAYNMKITVTRKIESTRFVIPKPNATKICSTNPIQEDFQESTITNNSPPSNWIFEPNNKNQKIIETIPVKKDSNAVSMTDRDNNKRNIDNQNDDALNIGSQNINEVNINIDGALYKRLKRKKKRLINLKMLYNVLVKVFLNHPVSLNDLRLKDFELHMLAEILIRKNRNLSLNRYFKKAG